MNYKEKYERAFNRAKKLYEQGTITESLGYVFPELKESKEERIRKELIEQIAYIIPNDDEIDNEGIILPSYQERINKYRAWLEKQRIDPYNGVCFDCYGHHWNMCARDNGIEIRVDGILIQQFYYEDYE